MLFPTLYSPHHAWIPNLSPIIIFFPHLLLFWFYIFCCDKIVNKRKLRKKGVYFNLKVPVYHWVSEGRNLKQRPWKKEYMPAWLGGWLRLMLSLLYSPGLLAQEMVPLTVRWHLLYQLKVNIISHGHVHRVESYGQAPIETTFLWL